MFHSRTDVSRGKVNGARGRPRGHIMQSYGTMGTLFARM